MPHITSDAHIVVLMVNPCLPAGPCDRFAPFETAVRDPGGVFAFDRLGLITYVNPRAADLLGRARAELLGRPLCAARRGRGRRRTGPGHRRHTAVLLTTRRRDGD